MKQIDSKKDKDDETDVTKKVFESLFKVKFSGYSWVPDMWMNYLKSL